MSKANDGSETILLVAEQKQVREEMDIPDPEDLAVDEQTDPALAKQADEFVARLLAFDPQDQSQVAVRQANVAAVEAFGARAQTEAANRSHMLEEPIRKLAARGEDGGAVAQSLVELKITVEDLDPGKLDLEAGWLSRTLGFLPGIGKPIRRYFTRFESSQMAGMNEQDVSVVNTSDSDIAAIFASDDEGAVVTWNPPLLQCRNVKGAKMVFDSSKIPARSST